MSAGFTAIHRAADSRAQPQSGFPARRTSIIIPALNEAANLSGDLLARLPEEVCEVILVDGGSTDETRAVAARRGWRVVDSPRGRARQMNAGAALATGDVLLFLHADTVLPADFARQIASVLALPGVVAGAFRLTIDAPGAALRVVERLANFRSRYLHGPFGDQAIFVSTSEFRAVGGYREQPIMEDIEMIRRLRRRGGIALASSNVRTSARRWQRHGVLRTTLLNQACQIAYRCGVSPERIHRWYYGSRL